MYYQNEDLGHLKSSKAEGSPVDVIMSVLLVPVQKSIITKLMAENAGYSVFFLNIVKSWRDS